MDVESLRTFIEVVRRGSFSAVAHDRNLSPSSISRVIATLEHELGVRLFQRNTRRLEPTEAGKYYFERVEHLIEQLEQAAHGVADLSEIPQGTLRVTAPVAFGELILAPWLEEFSKGYPELEFELIFTDTLLDLLADRIDLAVRLGTPAESSHVATRLFDETLVICASAEYLKQHPTPTTPEDVKEHDCLHFPMIDFAHWHFRDRAGNCTIVEVRGRWRMTNSVTLRAFTLAGLGVALLPRWAVWRELKNGELVALFADYRVSAADVVNYAWLMYPTRSYLPLKVRVLIDFLKSQVGDKPPWEAA